MTTDDCKGSYDHLSQGVWGFHNKLEWDVIY